MRLWPTIGQWRIKTTGKIGIKWNSRPWDMQTWRFLGSNHPVLVHNDPRTAPQRRWSREPFDYGHLVLAPFLSQPCNATPKAEEEKSSAQPRKKCQFSSPLRKCPASMICSEVDKLDQNNTIDIVQYWHDLHTLEESWSHERFTLKGPHFMLWMRTSVSPSICM